MAITDSLLKRLNGKPQEKAHEIADRDGLSARVSKRGKIVWQYRFRWQGKQQRMDLGTYPHMSLARARDELVTRKGQLAEGRDPRLERRAECRDAMRTNEDLIREWHAKYCVPNKKGAAEILRSFELHVFPQIGKVPVERTKPSHWLDVLEPLARDVPRIADRILTNAKQCHRWAAARELLVNQPLVNLSAATDLGVNKHRQSGRALSEAEIAVVWRAIDLCSMAYRSKLFVRLLLYYGCRPVELREARVEEFDFETGVWTIPAERHKTGAKTGRPLIRPILPEMAELLQEAAALSRVPGLLFSSERGEPAPMRAQATGDYPYAIRAAAIRYIQPIDHFSLYDLRKTARSHWSKLTEPHICEIMLGHKLAGMWQVYDRHDYLEEQRRAYRAWLDRLNGILVERL